MKRLKWNAVYFAVQRSMGRIALGQMAQYEHASQGIRSRPVRSCLEPLKPTRRRPDGYYSVLGVEPRSSDEEIHRAHRRLAKEIATKLRATKKQEKTAATKRLVLINQAKEFLLDRENRRTYDKEFFRHTLANNVNTSRSRVHRQGLSAKQRAVVSAIETCRQRIRRSRSRNTPLMQPKGIAESIVETRGTYINNRYARRGWVIRERKTAARCLDRRLCKFVAEPK